MPLHTEHSSAVAPSPCFSSSVCFRELAIYNYPRTNKLLRTQNEAEISFSLRVALLFYILPISNFDAYICPQQNGNYLMFKSILKHKAKKWSFYITWFLSLCKYLIINFYKNKVRDMISFWHNSTFIKSGLVMKSPICLSFGTLAVPSHGQCAKAKPSFAHCCVAQHPAGHRSARNRKNNFHQSCRSALRNIILHLPTRPNLTTA